MRAVHPVPTREDVARYHPDPKVRQHLEEHFERIARAVVAAFGEERVQALLVTGAPGRGETSAEMADGRLLVYSDYDLLVLVDAALPGDDILARELSAHWTERLRPEGVLLHVDVSIQTLTDLRRSAGTQAAWDVFHASTILRGAPPSRLLPDVAEMALSRLEPLRLIVNRFGGSLELLFPEVTLLGEGVERDDRLLESLYQSEKHIADAATALLMTRGEYVAPYRRRAELFERRAECFSHLENGEWLRSAAQSAVDVKLSGRVQDLAAVWTERFGDLRSAAFESWTLARRALRSVLPDAIAHATGRPHHDRTGAGEVRGNEILSVLRWTDRVRGRIGGWLAPFDSDRYRQGCIWGAIVETCLALPDVAPTRTETWSSEHRERCQAAHQLLDRIGMPRTLSENGNGPFQTWLELRERSFSIWRSGGAQ
ncbi:MAG: hypothetical protein RL885_07775 [Planctomycetota bacterium]